MGLQQYNFYRTHFKSTYLVVSEATSTHIFVNFYSIKKSFTWEPSSSERSFILLPVSHRRSSVYVFYKLNLSCMCCFVAQLSTAPLKRYARSNTMTSCFGKALFKIKDGDFRSTMTDLYNHECYEGFLKGEQNVKIGVSFYRVNNFNTLKGVKHSLRG